ncbi:MAG: glycosyltransferase family 4 protein [Candidatus Eisenbacteria bacterium]|uniref:Glycosyltransferase family 4 protein n=1 Tax=Eiseniibacteriota bacterium TaxID=2212470 RepID=A0A538UB28_UNCEI|nr:MAG: glycosyltransferase family 4 protein [Candidatus Eisenbacteria bacterium]
MKAILVSQMFPPETAAGAKRAGAMARALHEAFELEVVTVAPSYPDPGLFERRAWERSDRERGIPIQRAAPFRPHDSSLLRRAGREIAMSQGLIGRAKLRRGDLLIVSTPSMFLAPLGYLRARASGARFVWDVRDLTWRYARESVSPGPLQRLLLGGLERVMLAVLRRADLVIAATPGLGDVLLEHGVPRARMITIPNGVARALLDRFATAAAPPAGARPRVSYVGLMGYNHGIGILLDVARRLPEIDLVLIGDGPERPEIEQRLRRDGIPNLTLRGYVTDEAELIRAYLASDVLVNHTKGAPILDRIVNPAKLLEYFASGRPVVYAGAGFAARFLEERDLALVVPPDDPAALAAGIRRVLEEPEVARERGARARRVVETEFERETQMRALVAEMRRRFGRLVGAAVPEDAGEGEQEDAHVERE